MPNIIKEKIICSYCKKETKHYAKGFCRHCYTRNMRNGSPEYKHKTKLEDAKLVKKEQQKYTREHRYNPKSIRGKEFNELYKNGLTLKQIGDMKNITKERVRQILTNR